ncbi:SagB family peptide dehydrogenase [Streptomyces sp. NPDC051907]|uniref:SagB family peptide dehydrogenase n=1 Tax=Streptomyces sp. NPDC051907 TaxID=3155284 RepID=UPI003416E45D
MLEDQKPVPTDYLIGLRPGVSIENTGHQVVLCRGAEGLTLRNDEASLRFLEKLSSSSCTRSELLGSWEQNPPASLKGQVLLDRLGDLEWLIFSLDFDAPEGRSVVTAVPVSPGESSGMAPQPWDRPALRAGGRLSPFTYSRWLSGSTVLRSPLSAYEVRATGPALPRLLASFTGLRPPSAETSALLDLLHRARMTDEHEEDETVLEQWEFHDLLFHCHTRDGRHERPSGGTFRFAGNLDEPSIPPVPALHQSYFGDVIPLCAPEGSTSTDDMGLFQALQQRRSVRQHDAPITLESLGVFLHHCASSHFTDDIDVVQVSRRPYPGGGGLHELELYILVNSCPGLEPGLYHYRVGEHVLCRVADSGADTEALMDDAAFSMAHPRPQVLIVVTSRFQRIAWKYETIAYALTLKHVGCLLQTMYLVATAMSLAPCAIGGGNSELFSRVIGSSPLVESSVGEFALGGSARTMDGGR